MSATRKFRESATLVYQRLHALQRGEKCCFGVTLSQCLILELLHRQGPLTTRDLAAQLGLDSSTVTRVVDGLVRDQKLRRARDEQRDRRRVFVSLTARGCTLAEKLEASGDAYCKRILERIPPESRKDVIQTLRVLAEAIDGLPA
jgi:MarR family transcriptional regulator for hemolysin